MNISSLWLMVTLLVVCEQQIESAVVPPPWSDPFSNPCATQPGGWQLLYWAPLKKCFKIFTVLSTTTLNGKLIFNSTKTLTFVAGLSVSGYNGIESDRKQFTVQINDDNSGMPMSTRHRSEQSHIEMSHALRTWTV